MPTKTISVTTVKFIRVKDAFKSKFPIPTDEDGTPLHTEAEWPFVYLKKYVARIVKSHENDRQGKDNAPALDNDIMTVS